MDLTIWPSPGLIVRNKEKNGCFLCFLVFWSPIRVARRAKKIKKIVLSSIFPKRYFSAGMEVGGGKLPMVVVPLQGGQIALDWAIWPSPQVIVRFDRKKQLFFMLFWSFEEQYWSTSVLKN